MKINSAFRCQFSPQNGKKKNIFFFVEKERYKETNKCQYACMYNKAINYLHSARQYAI